MCHELYHHGVKGQKWGVRRYQNKDGSLTPAGQKRLAKTLQKDYKKNYQSGNPFRTSESYDEKLRSEIKSRITDADKKRITDAKDLWMSKVNESQKAEKELEKLAEKHGKDYYNKELKNNPDIYQTPRAKEKLFEYAKYDYGYDKARETRPDLHEASKSSDKYWDAYKNECKKVSDKLLGNYGNTKLHDCKYYSLTIKDTVGDIVSSMESQKWK